MAVSKHDRVYMQRLGQYKAASHAETTAHHQALPLAQRLQRSWALFVACRDTARLDAREDDPSQFYDLARARGLYRP
jgi:hypothetical protein